VIEAGLLDMEKSGVTFGEIAEAICGEIWDGDEDLAAGGLAAGISIRRTRLNSTRIFQCITIVRDFAVR
jgi:hypothetical protein